MHGVVVYHHNLQVLRKRLLCVAHILFCHPGYGNTYPNECWQGAWLLIVHQVMGMILNAVTVGIIFSRVSYPQQRGRTIAISDTAVIARRDGLLKFMFRIADIRQTQVSPQLTSPVMYYIHVLRSRSAKTVLG